MHAFLHTYTSGHPVIKYSTFKFWTFFFISKELWKTAWNLAPVNDIYYRLYSVCLFGIFGNRYTLIKNNMKCFCILVKYCLKNHFANVKIVNYWQVWSHLYFHAICWKSKLITHFKTKYPTELRSAEKNVRRSDYCTNRVANKFACQN